MSKEDKNSIKYVLEEMDPAEIVEFELRMESNPDLRIEVESIRRMKNKLNSLPDLSPPKHITDSILSYASGQSNKRSGFRSGYFLSAAIVILSLTTGSLIFGNFFEESERASNASAFPSFGNEFIQENVRESKELQPWVDHQDVLHLSGFESLPDQTIINNEGNSFNKLRPVAKYPEFQPFSKSVQLTGSN